MIWQIENCQQEVVHALNCINIKSHHNTCCYIISSMHTIFAPLIHFQFLCLSPCDRPPQKCNTIIPKKIPIVVITATKTFFLSMGPLLYLWTSWLISLPALEQSSCIVCFLYYQVYNVHSFIHLYQTFKHFTKSFICFHF